VRKIAVGAALITIGCGAAPHVDDPVESDAAPPPVQSSPRFACEEATRAEPVIILQGWVVIAYGSPPITTTRFPGVTVELVRDSDLSVMGSAVTDNADTLHAEPSFTMDLATDGLPFAGHWVMSKDGYPTTIRYERHPVVASSRDHGLVLYPHEIMDRIFDFDDTPEDEAVVTIYIHDCSDRGIENAQVAFDPPARAVGYAGPTSWFEPGYTMTNHYGHATGVGLPAGMVSVSITAPGRTPSPLSFQTVAGGLTEVFLLIP
jgi:hypothetical protein